jgi:hypothetical protein
MYQIVDKFTISPLIRNSKKVLAGVRAFLHAEVWQISVNKFPGNIKRIFGEKDDRKGKLLYNGLILGKSDRLAILPRSLLPYIESVAKWT